uniref:Putative salivary kunitz domain protein n=1 Tax=Ixodes ricinus TaxID=34613 RepID=A0A147BFG2_IXORI
MFSTSYGRESSAMKLNALLLVSGAINGLCVTMGIENKNAICNTPPSNENLGGTHAGWAYYSRFDICGREKFQSNDFSGKTNQFATEIQCVQTCRTHLKQFCNMTAPERDRRTNYPMVTYDSNLGYCIEAPGSREDEGKENLFLRNETCMAICADKDSGKEEYPNGC